MRVFKNAWFGRFARKQGITDEALLEAIERAERGLVDADLGGGVIKQRVARPGRGKSGGFRTIILYRAAQRAFFVFGFAKSVRSNITSEEEAEFRKAAGYVLGLTDQELGLLVNKGHFEELNYHGEEIPE